MQRNEKTMRVIFCGSRDWADVQTIKQAMRTHLKPGDVVIHGAARGADTIAATLARGAGLEVVPFQAEWSVYGKSAGPIRNQRMLDLGRPQLVIAFMTSPTSRGTMDMIKKAMNTGLPVIVYGPKGYVIEMCQTSLPFAPPRPVRQMPDGSTRASARPSKARRKAA
jgi:hypothetical protein